MADRRKKNKDRSSQAQSASPPEEKPALNNLKLAHHRRETRFSGPFPPPEILAGYQQIHQDFPERILCFTEKEQQHRHSLEMRIVESQILDLKAERTAEKRGQLYAFLICLAAFSCAGAIAFMGSPVSGVVLAMASLAGIVSVFITRKTKTASELRTENEHFIPPAKTDTSSP